jgi:hypothetical protein
LRLHVLSVGLFSVALGAALAWTIGLAVRPRPKGRRLVATRNGIRFETDAGGPRMLIDLDGPFGITLFATRSRERMVMAITTESRTAHIAARARSSEGRPPSRLLLGASTVADDDPVLDAVAPDGRPIDLGLLDLGALLGMLLRFDPGALDRCYLSDTRGAPVTLSGRELRIGRKRFDLDAPLEWRALLFQEPFGRSTPIGDLDEPDGIACGVAVYQGTWIRQGHLEAVLVSLLSSLGHPSPSTLPVLSGIPEVMAAVLRDLRLMHAPPELPPARELRVGIERVYMLRLRTALDGAPRAMRQDVPKGAAAR